ncbi:hypothetical protein [Lederbergia lenta]|uniref:hypothetical protein n=1 Tax=Lederbergia lenta TaxID=1467 RepID=UPI00203E3D31|nr:hypothetical protein [Lederbergia lenta]MCM3110025.1 hypothetical protein [Lederbergia lenta]
MSDNKERLTCLGECGKNKDKKSGFYNSNSELYKSLGKIPICKSCLKSTVNYNDMETVYSILKQFDIMFAIGYWKKAEDSKMDTFARYMTMANSLHQFEGRGWKDSIFINSVVKENSDLESDQESPVDEFLNTISESDLDSLKESYGYGYPDGEYILFEKKYQQLKPSFQLLTTMHEEHLREYCINKVKETLAKAKGSIKEAKDWATMAKDVAEAGKLKPSQMSKADLSQGLDGFGQLARMVEEKVDIIPVLPKFISQPKDKPDVVLWCYLNYIRDLQGLPEAEYKDIYNFYEERREDYEKQELDNDPSMRVEANG